MIVRFAGQVAKDLAYPETNEDAIAIGDSGRIVALSDGASESYDSRTWANLLVSRYVRSTALNAEWLASALGEYASRFDRERMSWSQERAFDRGSFASLLGLEYFPNHQTVEIVAIGDTLAVLLDGEELRTSFPYAAHTEFAERPQLFSTQQDHNAFFAEADFWQQHCEVWQLKDLRRPAILCLTDALGEWALRSAAEGSPPWPELRDIADPAELEHLVLSQRAAKNMRVDDSSLVVLSFGQD